MTVTGAKGSLVNHSQIACLLGQQVGCPAMHIDVQQRSSAELC